MEGDFGQRFHHRAGERARLQELLGEPGEVADGCQASSGRRARERCPVHPERLQDPFAHLTFEEPTGLGAEIRRGQVYAPVRVDPPDPDGSPGPVLLKSEA